MSIEEINSLNTCCYEHTKEMLKSNFEQTEEKSNRSQNFVAKEKKWQKESRKLQIITDVIFAMALSVSIFFIVSIWNLI